MAIRQRATLVYENCRLPPCSVGVCDCVELGAVAFARDYIGLATSVGDLGCAYDYEPHMVCPSRVFGGLLGDPEACATVYGS